MSTEPLQTTNPAIQSPSAVGAWQFSNEARALRNAELVKVIKGFGAWLRTHVVEPILWAVEAERSYNELMSLDERTLQDIGIQREEIPQLVARSLVQRKLGIYATAAGTPIKLVTPVAVPARPAPTRKLAA